MLDERDFQRIDQTLSSLGTRVNAVANRAAARGVKGLVSDVCILQGRIEGLKIRMMQLHPGAAEKRVSGPATVGRNNGVELNLTVSFAQLEQSTDEVARCVCGLESFLDECIRHPRNRP
jgi:hypothetical protein